MIRYMVCNKEGQYLSVCTPHLFTWGPEDNATLYRDHQGANDAGTYVFLDTDNPKDHFTVIKIDTQAALRVLHDLFESGDLDDHFYDIREREGLGWEGPRMLQWGKACEEARQLLKGFKP